jgi:hypothetical protein
VAALAENGSNINSGLSNSGSGSATLRGGSFTGRGGYNARAIFTGGSGTTLEVENVSALAEDANNHNSGLYIWNGAVAVARGGDFTGRGGNQAGGIQGQLGATLTAEGVSALAENATGENYGLGNFDNTTGTLRGGVITARGGTASYAVTNELNSRLDAEGVTALAEGGTSANYGLYSWSFVSTTVRFGSFTGRGGDIAYGIINSNSSATLEAEGVTAVGENGGSFNYGLYNANTAAANVTQGVLAGATHSVHRTGDSGSVKVSNSRLVDGAVNDDPNITCVLVTRGTAISIDGSTCP